MDIGSILSNMTLEEKISLCSGADFWQTKEFKEHGIPSLFMCDGPLGLRKQEDTSDMLGINNSRSSTCFPAEVTTASSWDVSLLERIGRAIGEEARNQKVGMVLGPGANIKRNPLCGRNFEYFSEDPYLTGKLAAAFIRGVEGIGVGTSLKHFAGNSQEFRRFTSDSVMDERTLREIYLAGFETAVKEGKPATLMCAYPKLNGVHCSGNRYLLTDILRKEWGFEGAVVTDWGAMEDRIEGFRAGCDLSMPGGSAYMEKETSEAVRNGELSEKYIDECAARVLRLVERGVKAMTGDECDYEAHHALCREAAVSGAVLLQNEDGLLPLREGMKIAVIGKMAEDMRFQGAGSSHINPMKVSQPLDFLQDCVFAAGCDENGVTTPELLAEVRKAASEADAAVVFAGLPPRYESEGFDRKDMKMPQGHIDMIMAAAQANPDTAVVLMCGSAVECPWADSVKSILYMGLPGQAGGEAAADLLYGRANPSGKLAESWPYRYEDVPSAEIFDKTDDALYEEGIYVGYRYYDKAGIPVRWAFGHGLSYTCFEYSDLKVSGNTVSVTVKNTGSVDGAEVTALFVSAPQDGIHRPLRELKGFEKRFLRAGESCEISFVLDERSFCVYADGWKKPAGRYCVEAGGLKADIDVDGADIVPESWQKESFYDKCSGKPDKAQWELLLGRKHTVSKTGKGSYTMENTVEEMREYSLVMKMMYFALKCVFRKSCGTSDPEDPEYRMMMAATAEGPLRSMYISSGMAGGVFPGLLEMANGHFFRGLWKMITG